jgi:hypothetical protein
MPFLVQSLMPMATLLKIFYQVKARLIHFQWVHFYLRPNPETENSWNPTWWGNII